MKTRIYSFAKCALLSATITFVLTASLSAQEMPAPRSAPRTPVNRQTLYEQRPAASASRDVTGQAMVLDGEKLRIGAAELRLFGIVPPQLSANYGPQARAALDGLVQGQNITCRVRDRDHDGRLLATCHNASNLDLALEELKRGLAVTARGSLTGTDLLEPYLAGELAAQNQRLGLWSVTIPAAATVAATPPAPVAAPVAAPEPVKTEAVPAAPALAPVVAQPEVKKVEAKVETPVAQPVKTASSIMPANLEPVIIEGAKEKDEPTSADFFARYQILIAGFLMLATALSIISVFGAQRRSERREELKAIGAALRGELLGARAVCQTRIKTITNDAEDRSASWPRLRSTLYQAYVGRIGALGAGLARQIASIYGLAGDYAAYFSAISGEGDGTTSKRQALQLLLGHIEEVLPRLEVIEKTGELPNGKNMPPLGRVASPQWGQTKTPLAANSAGVRPYAVTEIAAHKVQETVATLWEILRRFTREHLPERRTTLDENADYTTIIEHEMANMSFSEGEEQYIRTHVGENKNGGTGA